MTSIERIHPHDHDLGGGFKVRRLLPAMARQSMPAPASQRLLLARELRAANRPMDRTTDPAAGRPGGDRSRAR